ncbi:hypothetical protein EGM_07945, partial [Macaca fascicularis]
PGRLDSSRNPGTGIYFGGSAAWRPGLSRVSQDRSLDSSRALSLSADVSPPAKTREEKREPALRSREKEEGATVLQDHGWEKEGRGFRTFSVPLHVPVFISGSQALGSWAQITCCPPLWSRGCFCKESSGRESMACLT